MLLNFYMKMKCFYVYTYTIYTRDPISIVKKRERYRYLFLLPLECAPYICCPSQTSLKKKEHTHTHESNQILHNILHYTTQHYYTTPEKERSRSMLFLKLRQLLLVHFTQNNGDLTSLFIIETYLPILCVNKRNE